MIGGRKGSRRMPKRDAVLPYTAVFPVLCRGATAVKKGSNTQVILDGNIQHSIHTNDWTTVTVQAVQAVQELSEYSECHCLALHELKHRLPWQRRVVKVSSSDTLIDNWGLGKVDNVNVR